MYRIAAVYDPSGKTFNVKPVTTLEDGRVVTLESLDKRKERLAEKELDKQRKEQDERMKVEDPTTLAGETVADRLNPERMKMLIDQKMNANVRQPGQKSKTQLKKEAKFAPREPLPRPVLPEGIDIPSDEEENWMELWDLPDTELERRITREKRRKARARKELRIKQKSGKAERRAARDEKRRVYREIKQSWKILREEERRRRKFLIAMEDEEGKRLAEHVTKFHRAFALDLCAELGFTVDNVEGVDEIVPRALGMKGVHVDFDKLEKVGDRPGGLRIKGDHNREAPRTNRVDLGAIPDERHVIPVQGNQEADSDNDEDPALDENLLAIAADFDGQDYEALNLNHRTRRKLRRALEATQIRKELLVRETAIKHCEENSRPIHPVLRTSARPINVRGHRTLESGRLETAKQERVRSRVELAEFNRQAKILRRQAKEMSIEAGIRIYLELMGRIPKREGLDELVEARAAAKLANSGIGPTIKDEGDDEEQEEEVVVGGIWPTNSRANMTASEWLDAWPIPDDPMVRYEGTRKWRETKKEDEGLDSMEVDVPEDVGRTGSTTSSEEDGSDSEIDAGDESEDDDVDEDEEMS